MRFRLAVTLDYWVTPRLAAGYPSNLISLEEFTIKLYQPLRFKPRGRYNLIFAKKVSLRTTEPLHRKGFAAHQQDSQDKAYEIDGQSAGECA